MEKELLDELLSYFYISDDGLVWSVVEDTPLKHCDVQFSDKLLAYYKASGIVYH